MKKLFIAACFLAAFCSANAQETLQSVTDRGSSTSNPITITNAHLNITNMSDADVQLGATAASATTKYAWIQSSVSGRNLVFNATNGGNVGIGTITPIAKLDVNDGIALVRDNSVDGSIYLSGNVYGTPSLQAANYLNNIAKNLSVNPYGGNVGIGTTSPTEKLSVKGKIRAQEVKVETANWPDYVFTPTHRQTPLPELEQYIQTNRHLPEIPSAAQVEKEGISLGEMNAKLVKKIEELTLYILEQEKRITRLESQQVTGQ